MSVKIRMKRLGRKNRSFFRICATDVRAPRDGRVIEELGSYDPTVPETDARVVLNGERVAYWLGVGAKASPKVSVLIKKYGKDGTHLDAQQQALNRMAARKSNAITKAQEAARLAAIAENKRREEAAAKRKEEEAAAIAAADAEAEAEVAAQAASEATTEGEQSDNDSSDSGSAAAASAESQTDSAASENNE